MTALAWLVPIALSLGALGLAGFLWSLKSGQFEDLQGAGWRALDDETELGASGKAMNAASVIPVQGNGRLSQERAQ